MNLSQLRELVLDLRAWTSSGKTFDQRLNKAINLAYRKMSKDVPEVLVPSFESHHVIKDQTTADTKAYADGVDTDPWVLQFVDEDKVPLGTSTKVTWRPETNATWDGIMHIELTSVLDNSVQRFRCREFWSSGSSYYVTLDRPFNETSPAPSKHKIRIYQPSIYLKSDYIRLLDASAWDAEYENDQLVRLDVGAINRHALRDFRGENNGTPTSIYQDRTEQLPGPKAPPSLTKTGSTPWSTTTLPPGEFRFKYTYVWGAQSEIDGVVRNTPGGLVEAIIESPPSAESAKFSITDGEAPLLTFAPVDHMLNFSTEAPLRGNRTGLKIRIYASRVSTRKSTTPFPTTLELWPADDKYYPIADIDPVLDPSVGGVSYAWNGSSHGIASGIPDMARPLGENHVYRGWSLYPHQDRSFRIDFRVLRSPEQMVDDSDHPIVEPDAESALVEIVLYYLCLMDGADQSGAQVHLSNYDYELRTVRSQHASPAGSVTPSTWDNAGSPRRQIGQYKEI